MMFTHKKHSVPGLNTTSTADISFMLLIFFLVTSSMDVDKGLGRKLPPIDKSQTLEETVVDKSDLLSLRIDADGKLFVNDRPFAVSRLRKRVRDFVLERKSKHLISVDVDAKAEYDAYFHVQNEMTGAYRDVRNAMAIKQFRHPFDMLKPKQKEIIMNASKQHVAETYNMTDSIAKAANTQNRAETEKGGKE
jgi:biopolymer transport protein ExbD